MRELSYVNLLDQRPLEEHSSLTVDPIGELGHVWGPGFGGGERERALDRSRTGRNYRGRLVEFEEL
jgi:hypothetical protein